MNNICLVIVFLSVTKLYYEDVNLTRSAKDLAQFTKQRCNSFHKYSLFISMKIPQKLAFMFMMKRITAATTLVNVQYAVNNSTQAGNYLF